MDPKQLELDFQAAVKRKILENSDTAQVLSLEKARQNKEHTKKRELYRAILESIEHIDPSNKRFR